MPAANRRFKVYSGGRDPAKVRDMPLPVFRRSTKRVRKGVLLCLALSIAAHLAVLGFVPVTHQVVTPPVPPVTLDVVLVQPPAPEPPRVAPPLAPAVPDRPPPRRSVEKKREPEKRESAPVAPAPRPPVLAVPRPEPEAPQATAVAPPVAKPAPEPSAESQSEGAPASPHGNTPAGGRASAPSYNAAYLRNPAPRYPLIARRNGEQGTVLLRVLVTREGEPGKVTIEKTSGSAALDAAALNTVKEWRFVPAQENGRPVAASVLVPIVFRLQDAS